MREGYILLVQRGGTKGLSTILLTYCFNWFSFGNARYEGSNPSLSAKYYRKTSNLVAGCFIWDQFGITKVNYHVGQLR
jgi:hypothetical protein